MKPSFPPSFPSPDLAASVELVEALARARFYGTLTLSYQAGHVVNLRKEQSIKPADLIPSLETPKDTENDRADSR
jgi:hypothetical protein